MSRSQLRRIAAQKGEPPPVFHSGQLHIVCAAIRSKDKGWLVIGPRHFDNTMYRQLAVLRHVIPNIKEVEWEQGFIDQHGVFWTREEAFQIATDAGQIIRRVGGDEGKLFSENLY